MDHGSIDVILWEFQFKVNDEDLNYVKDIDVQGVSLPVFGVDAHLCMLKVQGAKIQVAKVNDEVVGFLLYHLIADCILFVRGLYLYPEYEGYGIGVKLISTLNKPIKKIIFQTRTKSQPKRLFGHIGARKKIIHADKDLSTWEMEW